MTSKPADKKLARKIQAENPGMRYCVALRLARAELENQAQAGEQRAEQGHDTSGTAGAGNRTSVTERSGHR